MEIRPAMCSDLEAVKHLLEAAGLPTADLDERLIARFLVAAREGRVLGAVACEPAGANCGLLRSLVVAPDCQGRGLGEHLVAEIEAVARSQGAQTLYLLTETAQGFFDRMGYVVTDRQQAPAEIRATSEFARLCPAGAVCLRKDLSLGIQ
ncbi:MAG: arsenic resistance N-acetyltransferase ArsN2 [Burkholderiales bacterium]